MSFLTTPVVNMRVRIFSWEKFLRAGRNSKFCHFEAILRTEWISPGRNSPELGEIQNFEIWKLYFKTRVNFSWEKFMSAGRNSKFVNLEAVLKTRVNFSWEKFLRAGRNSKFWNLEAVLRTRVNFSWEKFLRAGRNSKFRNLESFLVTRVNFSWEKFPRAGRNWV